MIFYIQYENNYEEMNDGQILNAEQEVEEDVMSRSENAQSSEGSGLATEGGCQAYRFPRCPLTYASKFAGSSGISSCNQSSLYFGIWNPDSLSLH